MHADDHPYQNREIRRHGLTVGGGLVLLVLLAALAVSYLRPVLENVRLAERGLQGLAYMTQIRQVIEPLQEYRGLMTMGKHNPALRVNQREEQQRAEVDRAFAGLLAMADEFDDPLGLTAEIAALHREWERLRVRHKHVPDEVFDIFTTYIGRLLALHRRAVTASGLDLDPVADTYNLIQILDLMLEYVLEPTGQIRALYAGFLADPTANGLVRDRIIGRAALVVAITGRIERHAALARRAHLDPPPALVELPAGLRAATGRTLALTREYSPELQTPPAAAQDFFAAATEIISEGYQLHDSAMATARQSLAERLAAARAAHRKVVPFFVLGGLGIMALVVWGAVGWRRHERVTADIFQQNRFQALVAEISTTLLNAGRDSIDTAINDAIRLTGEHSAADRAYLFRFSADGSRMSNTHEWCAPGVTAQREDLQDIPSGDFSWWQGQMAELFLRGGQLVIDDVGRMPPEAATEQAILESQEIRSLCCAPIIINRQVAGFVGLDSLRLRHWHRDRSGHTLTMVANLLSAALERDALERELIVNAITDGLTGLYNRRHFLTHLVPRIEEYRRSRKPFALAMFDIDHFKRLNDTHGHLAGDCVLQQFAGLLKEGFRAFDMVARYGGEEFVVMLIDSDGKTAAATARRLLAAVREHHFPCEGKTLRITVSGGVVEAGEITAELSPNTLIDAADNRLYQAKEAGRDRVVEKG